MGTLTSWTACMAALSLQPVDRVVADQVDLIELNHYYDELGRAIFDQLIFYDWCPRQARYQVRAWRLLKTPSQMPTRNYQRDEFVTTWYDGDKLRRVTAKSHRESWTQYDPELVEREFLPKEKRRELSR